MILVTVRDKQGFDFFLVFNQVGVVGNHVVDAHQVFVREDEARIDDDDFVGVFQTIHVFTDFPESA